MLNILKPGYNSPNRKRIAGDLLNAASDRLEQEVKMAIKNSTGPITLSQDGWSNVRNDPILATSLHVDGKCYLYDAKDCEDEQKTSEYCALSAIDAIKSIEEKYEKKVFAIVTDNENKMLKMRKIVTEKFPDVFTFGCNSHYLNLVEQAIAPSNIIAHIRDIHKFFRNHHRPHSWLKKKNGKTPQLDTCTRWNSQLDCLETFIANFKLYNEITNEHEEFVTNEQFRKVKQKLGNVGLFNNAVDLLNQLKIVGKSLDKFQCETTYLPETVHIWFQLINHRYVIICF